MTTASNLRVESFLFTRESFETVRDRLAPGGVFVLSNVYWKPWLVQRIARTLEETFALRRSPARTRAGRSSPSSPPGRS